jgi:hypothetical protein
MPKNLGCWGGIIAKSFCSGINTNRMSRQIICQIAEAQQVLKENGFYSGPLDGTMSDGTVDALRSFQQSRDLNITGRIDSDTA